MTIIELFPWLLAICIATLTGAFSVRGGLTESWALAVAVAAGIISLVLYRLGMELLVSWPEQRRTRSDFDERENRYYLQLDSVKMRPVGENLHLECAICGNTVPSLPKKDVGCKCQNIMIDASSGTIKVREHVKVKLFAVTGNQVPGLPE